MGSSNWDNGESCEGRVAAALWDIYDSNQDGIDLDVYSWYFTDIFNVAFGARLETFMAFWNAWQVAHSLDVAHCLWQNTIDPGMNLRPNEPSTPTGPTLVLLGHPIPSPICD